MRPEISLSKGVWGSWGVLLRIELLIAVLALGCRGCNERSAAPPQSATIIRPQIYPHNTRLLEMAGKIDAQNRYPSVVIVKTHAQLVEEQIGQCGGVLIAPRLVLTAAHCVCIGNKSSLPGNEGGIAFDGSACESIAFATTVSTKPVDGGLPSTWTEDYRGTVRPHPEFKLLLDAQGNVISSAANLAVILLDEPVASGFPYALLSDAEVQATELVTIVSYGYDEVIGGRYGERRFSKARITQVLEQGGRVLFEQPGQHAYKGESGGAVLHEDGQEAVLVGILSRSLGGEPSFTSTYPYLGWLHDEVQSAARMSVLNPVLPP